MKLEYLIEDVLHHIFRDLHPLDIECLARTFNRKVYHICLPFIQDRIASQKHAKRLLDVYSLHSDPDTHIDAVAYARSVWPTSLALSVNR
jgi:hypothetical protein